MEPLGNWNLWYMLDPAMLAVLTTSVLVTFGSAFRALNYTKKAEKDPILSKTIITLKTSHALMIPVGSSFNLIILFYFFSTVENMVLTLTVITWTISLYVCFITSFCKLRSSRLLAFCFGVVVTWLVSGNWILYSLLGISTIVMTVTHFRLQNVKVCAMLLMCLFVCDIFWVFFSERFFGQNVMDSVVTQKAISPVYKVSKSLNLPGLQWVEKELEVPGKIVFPQNLFRLVHDKELGSVMIGLGDMTMPAVLLTLILCFDHRKSKNPISLLELVSSKGHKYIWYAISGYIIGLVACMATSILTLSSQPVLLYLVPSTLGPVIVVSWMRGELEELWEASLQSSNGKTHDS